MSNKANALGSGGGAVMTAARSRPTFTTCQFLFNSAAYGAVFSVNTLAGLEATSCTFSENVATRAGGGFHFMECNQVSISDSSFTKNQAMSTQGGGVLYSQTTCTPKFSSCQFSNNFAFEGGVAKMYGPASPDFEDCRFESNQATVAGGAIWLSAVYDGLISTCTFSRNILTTTTQGGAAMALFSGSNPNIVQSAFEHHSAPIRGSAVFIQNSNSKFQACHFIGNVAQFGAAHVAEDSSPAFDQCTFVANVAQSASASMINGGGALYLSGFGAPTVLRTEFRGNVAEGSVSGGGAVFVDRLTLPNIETCSFFNNTARRGGAVLVSSLSVTRISDCVFKANTAMTFGGGVTVDPNSTVQVSGTTFQQNRADDSGGGVAVMRYAHLGLAHVTFEANTVVHFGGGAYFSYQSMQDYVSRNVTGVRNMAKAGSVFFWGMATPPFQGQCSNCTYVDNLASDYGDDVASDVNAVHTANSLPIYFRGGQPIRPQITYALIDFFGQEVDNSRLGDGIQCVLVQEPSLKHVLGQTVAFTDRGRVSYVQTSFSGRFNSSYKLDAVCTWSRCEAEEIIPHSVAIRGTPMQAELCAVGYKARVDTENRVICERCMGNTYSVTINATECLPCPSGMTCPGGSQTMVYPGFWVQLTRPETPYTCLPAVSCLGGPASTCEVGHTGRVCGVCEKDYMMTIAGCSQCNNFAIWKPLLTLLVCGTLALIGGLIAMAIWKYDPQNAESKEEVFENVLKKKQQKLANAISRGDPLAIAEGKAAVKVAEERLQQFRASTVVKEHRDGNMAIEGNPLQGSSTQSGVGKGAGGVRVPQGQQQQEEEDRAPEAEGEGEEPDMEGMEGFDIAEGVDLAEFDVDAMATTVEGAELITVGDSSLAGSPMGSSDLGVALEQMSVTGKILLAYIQTTLGSILTMPGVPWPAVLLNQFAMIFSFMSFDMVNVLPLQCMVRMSFYDLFILSIYMPPLIISVIFIVLAVQYIRHNGFSFRPQSNEYIKAADLCWKLALLSLFVLYPSLSFRVMSVFDCRKIGDDYWLRQDVELQCYTIIWAQYAIVGVMAVCIYPLGVPFLFFTILRRNQHRLQSPGVKARYGFLYSGFVMAFWGGELLEMARKFFMTSFLIFVAPGSITQIGAALMVSAVFIGLHTNYDPYADPVENRVQTISLWGSFLNMFCAFLVSAGSCATDDSQTPANGFGSIMLGVSLFSVFGSIYVVFFEVILANADLFSEFFADLYSTYVEPILEGTDMEIELEDVELDDDDGFEQEDEDGGFNPGGGTTAGAAFLAAAAMSSGLKEVPPYVLEFAESLYTMYQVSENRGITRQGFRDLLHRWDHTEYRTIGETLTTFEYVSGGMEEIERGPFIMWCNEKEIFGQFTPQVLEVALDEFAKDREVQPDGVVLYRYLWITQLFNAHAARDGNISYNSFFSMMKNFSRDVNPVLVKATFKRMALVDDKQTQGEAKQRMANAIRGGKVADINDDYALMASGIPLTQFVKWAAAVFMNCDMPEFIEGILEMIKTDGSDVRRAPTAATGTPAPNAMRHVEEEEDMQEESLLDQEPSCGPVQGFDVKNLFADLCLDEAVEQLVSQSRYSIWRSIKGRQLAADMVVSSKLIFTHVASVFEHRRQQLSKELNPLVAAEKWPPENEEARRVAQRVMNEVCETLDESTCSDYMRKSLIFEYIRQVNAETYSSSTLKDQMQALVLANVELLLSKLSEHAFRVMVDMYNTS